MCNGYMLQPSFIWILGWDALLVVGNLNLVPGKLCSSTGLVLVRLEVRQLSTRQWLLTCNTYVSIWILGIVWDIIAQQTEQKQLKTCTKLVHGFAEGDSCSSHSFNGREHDGGAVRMWKSFWHVWTGGCNQATMDEQNAISTPSICSGFRVWRLQGSEHNSQVQVQACISLVSSSFRRLPLVLSIHHTFCEVIVELNWDVPADNVVVVAAAPSLPNGLTKVVFMVHAWVIEVWRDLRYVDGKSFEWAAWDVALKRISSIKTFHHLPQCQAFRFSCLLVTKSNPHP